MNLLGDASPWLHDAVSTLMATFSGEDMSFLPFVNLVCELDKRANGGDAAAAAAIQCVRQTARLIDIAVKQVAFLRAKGRQEA